jgi:hypothetical protein
MSHYIQQTGSFIKDFTGQKKLEKILPPVLGFGVAIFLVLITNRDYPYVGHDYRYFISRIVDTTLHIHANGLSIQWYTPSFGGGLPAYPNPQHLEYSLVQWVSVFLDPWAAILLTTAVVSLLGYFFFYRVMHETLQLSWMASSLGGLFFIGNGFYIEHVIAGHMGFQLFPLGAVILYFLISPKHGTWLKIGVIALVLTLFIHQAGFTIAIVLFLSLALALPVIHLYRPQLLRLRQLTSTSALAVLLAMAMTGSKVFAVAAFMEEFPRHVVDVYNVSVLQGLVGIAAQLFGVMTLAPIVMIAGKDAELISGGLSALTGAKYGIWELDCSLSPVLIFLLLSGLMELIAGFRKQPRSPFRRDRIYPFILLTVIIWIVLELTLAKGTIYSFSKQLPILESLHVNVRFTAAFILPLTIAGAFQANRFFSRGRSMRSFFVLCTVTGLSLLTYFSLNPDVHSRYLDVRTASRIYEQAQDGNYLPVRQISNVGDLDGFMQNSSVYRPYEALFGYSLETFNPEVHPGSVYEVRDGYFNMTNPASLVFPEMNHTHPFERIPESEREKLEMFLHREQPEWQIPAIQKILNLVSLFSVVVCLGMIAWQGFRRSRSRGEFLDIR